MGDESREPYFFIFTGIEMSSPTKALAEKFKADRQEKKAAAKNSWQVKSDKKRAGISKSESGLFNVDAEADRYFPMRRREIEK
jgi:hypothetical protein